MTSIRILMMVALAVGGMFIAGLTFFALTEEWLLVHVQARGEDNLSLWVPVPMRTSATILSCIPDVADEREMMIEMPSLQQIGINPSKMNDMVVALQKVPDSTLVQIDSNEDHVTVKKQGDNLCVSVNTPQEKVNARLPIAWMTHALKQLPKNGEKLDVRKLVANWPAAENGRLVDVHSPEADVTIWTW